jgi:drug/metabolite transporter (DMT)-like permease
LIVVPDSAGGGSTAFGLALMLAASVSWSTGSFVAGRLALPADPFVATVYEMIGGGVVLVAGALALGEWRDVDAATFELGPLAAWAYLAVAGSLVGFSAYAWLLRHAPISQVVTHQYVNPLVAIALGALLLDERLTATTLAGAAVVVGAVFITVRHERLTPPAVLDRSAAAAPTRAR